MPKVTGLKLAKAKVKVIAYLTQSLPLIMYKHCVCNEYKTYSQVPFKLCVSTAAQQLLHSCAQISVSRTHCQ
jgi:hypothetical protein